jgi:hypothetical protein
LHMNGISYLVENPTWSLKTVTCSFTEASALQYPDAAPLIFSLDTYWSVLLAADRATQLNWCNSTSIKIADRGMLSIHQDPQHGMSNPGNPLSASLALYGYPPV